MTATFERNKGLLLNILPEEYDYQIIGISIRDATADIASEVKLEAHFRVNVNTAEEFETFLTDFNKASGTFYNKKKPS